MQLRFLEYLVALAEERHFAEAARRCSVTQPTLSAGISSLEKLLGKRLVLRDRRFIDLTAEGAAVLGHARLMIAQHAALRSAIDAAGPLQGVLRIGAIPAAMPNLGAFAAALRRQHPGLRLAIRQLTSSEILEAIASFEIDAGLAYADPELPSKLTQVPLYTERFQLAVHAEDRPVAPVEPQTLAAMPLALLHQGMMNRRILDRQMAARGLTLDPVATADSYIALLSLVALGGLNAIVTDAHARFAGPQAGIALVDIAGLDERNEVALIASAREPVSPIVRAALAAAHEFVIDTFYQR